MPLSRQRNYSTTHGSNDHEEPTFAYCDILLNYRGNRINLTCQMEWRYIFSTNDACVGIRVTEGRGSFFIKEWRF
ncbi:hypothetical protein ACF0H5_015247 [Mactra antiquata]